MQGRSRKIAATMAGVILTVILLRTCVATPYLIPSPGMENSLYRGERILVNKWSYGLRLPLMSLWGYHRWAEKAVSANDILVFNNPANRSQASIDQREVFISRCLGLPGDTILTDSLLSVIHSARNNPDRKFLYRYPRNKEKEVDSLLTLLAIRPNALLGQDTAKHVRSFSRYEYYLLEQALEDSCWIEPAGRADSAKVWKSLVVPGKGKAVRVYPWNRALLCNTLVLHEKKRAEIKNNTLYVEGVPTEYCHFTKDYYWVEADNSINLSDSRLFGFVPKDHIIGKACLIWFSKKEGTGCFDGYRRERMWRKIE